MLESSIDVQSKISQIENRLSELENGLRSHSRQFEMLIEHITRSDAMIQDQELRLWKLEQLHPPDDMK